MSDPTFSSEEMTQRRWIVVNTQPHREGLAVSHIANQGFEPYCPMLRKRIRHARRHQDVLRPLFPGYLFVAVDPDRTQWRPLLSTVGVRTVLRNGERPNTLPDQFIEALRAREVEGAIIKPSVPYAIGDKVVISGGPMDGLVGDILQLDDNGRLTVLLELLSGKVRTRLAASQVQRHIGE